jgi:hypothetical protein
VGGVHPDEPDLESPPVDRSRETADGSPRPAPDLPPPAESATPVPDVDPSDESARQVAATVRSVSRVEEAN